MKIYRCNNCGYEYRSKFGICPECKDGIGEEYEEAPSASSSSGSAAVDAGPRVVILANTKVDQQKALITTDFPGLNRIASTAGGFLAGQVILLAAHPGVGKSTLCSQIAMNEDTLYITTEESANQVAGRFQRLNPNVGENVSILSTTNVEAAIAEVETNKYKLVIVDSINNFNDGASYQQVAKITTRLMRVIKATGKVGILISQVAKNGQVTGMNATVHTPDTVIYMERSESGGITLYSTKNRFAPVGEIALFKHGEQGLEETTEEKQTSGIGIAKSKIFFGSRHVPISAQALVVPTGNTYGQVYATGVNPARVKMLVGILSYFLKSPISTTMNVYVTSSQGVKVDSTDFDSAICAAIISSMYGKEMPDVEICGEVRLNGQIIPSNRSTPTSIAALARLINNKSNNNTQQ